MTMKTNTLMAFLLAAGALAASATGCELIASVDRTQIPSSGGGGAGGAAGGTTSSSASTGTGGTGGTGGATCSGGEMACTAPGDCPAPSSACVTNTCKDGCCGTKNTAAGQACTANGGTVCDGNGHCVGCVMPSDCPDQQTACKTNTCEAGTCGTSNAPDTTSCNDDGGRICDGNGACVACNAASDCPAQTTVCKTNTCDANTCGTNDAAKGTPCSDSGGVVCDGSGSCVAMHCTDGVMDADETDVDCGGSCGGCADDDNCDVAADCQSGVCDPTAKTCTPAACDDGVQNGDETDVDCGGSCATKCDDQKHCAANADCVNDFCFGSGPGTCVSCGDGAKDGNETDVDCGGPQCDNAGKLCATNEDCAADADCQSGFCQNDTTCQLKGDGTSCTGDAQCQSGVCGANGSGNCCTASCTGGACGATGCNASGACQYPGAGTSCGTPSCANGQLTPAGSCNGSGSCNPGTAAPCAGGFVCASATACKTACSSDADCQASSDYCSNPGPSGTCVPKGAAGSSCSANDQCTSGLCGVNGTGNCCTAACNTTDPTCGALTCDASGACQYPSGWICAADMCSGNMLTTSTCNGSGACTPGAPTPCPNGLKCAAGGFACLTSCSTDTDCVSASDYCDTGTGTCTPKGPPGAFCSGDDQCTSGICGVSGTGNCCSVACSTGDPTCGASGCDAGGACVYPDASFSCGTSTCSNAQLSSPACDGSGSCVTGSPAPCPGHLTCADGSSCVTQCSVTGVAPNGTSVGCVSGYYCDTTATPTCSNTLKSTGALCNNSFECSSGTCCGGPGFPDPSCTAAGCL